MQRVSLTEATNNVSALIDRVRRGETILICDRNRPVARMLPVGADEASGADADWLAGLVRDGLREAAGREGFLVGP